MIKLRAKGSKPIRLAPVRPNAGNEAAYRRKLVDLIDAMHRSVMFHVLAEWKKAGMALDAAPEKQLDSAVKKMGSQWEKTYKSQAKGIAKKFQDGALRDHDIAFQRSLRKAGFTVRMQMDDAIEEALQDGLLENMDLITSIPTEYMYRVTQLVQESVAKGRNMGKLTDELGKIHGITRRRAALIARDQNNKATAIIHRVRQKQVGIKKAQWIHTSASKFPRPEHTEWGAVGATYDIDKGMFSEEDGEYVWPGTPINCGCTSMSIIPGMDDSTNEEE